MTDVDWRGLAEKVARFGAISGVGLALDFVVFIILTALGWGAASANLISATCGVSFVYFAATRKVFDYRGGFLLPLFLIYLAYQAVAISAASWAVGAIAGLGAAPVAAKLLVLPLTFCSNYVFMHFLTRRSGASG